jgi:glucokinase
MRSLQDKKVVIGLDLGGTNLRIAGVTRSGEVVCLYREETRASAGPEDLIARIAGGLRKVEGELRREGREVLGASLGVPGVVSRREGVVASSPNLPGWKSIPLLKRMSAAVDLPLLIENDANAAVFGEFWVGAGRGRQTVVLLTLGTGVGGGIMTDGRLLRGADGMAGEIGHLTVEREGQPCLCGNRGCLEQYSSATGIARRYRQLKAENASGDPVPGGEGSLTAARVHSRAVEGDPYALQTLREAGMYLGTALASLVNIINPESIIIGGGVLPAWDFFMPAAREEMLSRAFQAPAERVELVPAALGDRAGFIGAAGLFWQDFEEASS